MRPALAFVLLLSVAAGCLGPPPAGGSGPSAPAASLPPEPPAPPPDETLRVTWSPNRPAPGDLLQVRIDAPVRWPEPRCDVAQLARVGGQGGEWSSKPATLRDGAYVCESRIAADTVLATVLVTRPDGDVMRISGAHVLPVERAEGPRRVAFDSFQLGADEPGSDIVRLRARVSSPLMNVGVPTVGPVHGSNSTSAWFHTLIVPAGLMLHRGGAFAAEWEGLHAFDLSVDVPALLRESEREHGGDYPERDFFVLAFGVALNERAYGATTSQAVGFGACAGRACFVVDP